MTDNSNAIAVEIPEQDAEARAADLMAEVR